MIDTTSSLRQQAIAVLDWFAVRWQLEDQVAWPAILVTLWCVAATVLVPPLWRAGRHAVTLVHEMGHVVVARLCGRRIDGIRLHHDTSGLALTRGRPRGIGMLLTALAGYPAPGLVGVGLVASVLAGRPGIGLLALTVVVAAAFFLVHNLWGLLVTTVVLALGVFLTVGAWRAGGDLARAHAGRHTDDPVHSDATAAAGSLLVAGSVRFWLTYFRVVTAGCALVALAGLAVIVAGLLD